MTESHMLGPRNGPDSGIAAEPGELDLTSASQSYPLLVTVTIDPARGEVLVARLTVTRSGGEPGIRGAYADGLLTVSRDAASILKLTGTPVVNLDPLVEHLRLERSDADGLGVR